MDLTFEGDQSPWYIVEDKKRISLCFKTEFDPEFFDNTICGIWLQDSKIGEIKRAKANAAMMVTSKQLFLALKSTNEQLKKYEELLKKDTEDIKYHLNAISKNIAMMHKANNLVLEEALTYKTLKNKNL